MNITEFFTDARSTLDAHHDRRERIIKLSRDITAQSKKMVFALHRAANQPAKKRNSKEALSKQEEIMSLFRQLSTELGGPNYYRYARSFTGGLEEFIEGVAFLHYLEHQALISKDQVDALFRDKETGSQWLHVRPEEYVLGIADFTGELMRYAIQMVTSGEYERALKICRFLREISTDFEMLSGAWLPALDKKMGAFRSSLAKVERACYAFQIRGSEYPKEMYHSIVQELQARYEEDRRDEDE